MMAQSNFSKPSVSLVIPTFNRAALIGETLMSAIAQVPPFDEIIVIDDGSEDDTAAIIAKLDYPIKYLRVESGGVQRARNVGAEMATSDWLAFCDSDDLLDETYTAAVFAYLSKEPPIDLAYVNFCNFSDEGQRPPKLSLCPFDYLEGATIVDDVAINIPQLLIRNFQFQPFFPSGMAVHRRFYFKLNGFDPALRGVGAEDWDFTLRAIVLGRVALFKKPLAYVRRHTSNDSSDSLRMLKGELEILQTFDRRFQLQGAEAIAWKDTVDRRRAAVASASYQQQLFDDVVRYMSWGALRKGGVRLFVKYLISRFPSALSSFFWRYVQRFTKN